MLQCSLFSSGVLRKETKPKWTSTPTRGYNMKNSKGKTPRRKNITLNTTTLTLFSLVCYVPGILCCRINVL